MSEPLITFGSLAFRQKMKTFFALFSIAQCTYLVSQFPNEGTWTIFFLFFGLILCLNFGWFLRLQSTVNQPATDYETDDSLAYDDLNTIGESGFEAIKK